MPGARTIAREVTNGIKGVPGQRVTFSVDTDANDVLAYYERVFTEEGWEASNNSVVQDGVHYFWRGCPVFGMDVIARDRGDGSAEVELNITKEYCL
jgi:hypothetical protein